MKRYRLSILVLVFILTMVGCGDKSADNIKLAEKAPISSGQKSQIKSQDLIEMNHSKSNESEKKGKNNQEQNKLNEEVLSTQEKQSTAHANATPITANQEKVKLIITRDFGRQILLHKNALIDDQSSVLNVLQANADVKTQYDGGFIGSINGLKTQGTGLSGIRSDWFYFINGVCSHVGSMDYELGDGETVWWDYHPWSAGFANSAVIGCYPEPFVHGYNGKTGSTVILYAEKSNDCAARLQTALQASGVRSVKVSALQDDLIKNRQGPTLVVGDWDTLKGIPYLEGLNKAYRKNGTSVHLLDNGIELLNYKGQVARKIEGSAAAIFATGEGLGDAKPLWLVTGSDNAAVAQAADILIKNPGKVSRVYSAALYSGELIALPLQ